MDLLGLVFGAIALLITTLSVAQTRMRFMLLACFCGICASGCILMIATTTDLGVVDILFKIAMFFLILASWFAFSSILDYIAPTPLRGLTAGATVFIIAYAFLIFTNSDHELVFQGLQVGSSPIHYFDFTPGILFKPLITLCVLLIIVAVVSYIQVFVRQRQKVPYIALFLVIIILPVLGIIPIFFDILPIHWIPSFFFSNLTLLVLCIYASKWHVPDWNVLGRYAAVQEMSDALIIIDSSNMLVDMNPQAERFFPALAGAKPGRSLLGMKGFPEEVLDSKTRILNYQVPPYGFTRHYSISNSTLKSANKDVGACIIVHDDTDSVDASNMRERETLESNTSRLINASPFICLLFDTHGNILDFNSAALRFFGYQSKEELRGILPTLLDEGMSKYNYDSGANIAFRRQLQKTLELGKNEFQSDFTVNDRNVYMNFFMKSLYLGSDPSVAVYMIIPSAQESLLETLVELSPLALDLVDMNLAPSISNQRLLYLLGFESKEQYMKYHWSAFPSNQADGRDTMELLFEKAKEVLLQGYLWFPLTLRHVQSNQAIEIEMHLIYLRRGEDDLIFRFFSDTGEGEHYADFYAYLLPILRGSN
ncbi:MAG: PAS domain-containing protein [Coriobacteriia bacterium]|nr:PAS domain-containing protein [Coriobacteriia bacterium]